MFQLAAGAKKIGFRSIFRGKISGYRLYFHFFSPAAPFYKVKSHLRPAAGAKILKIALLMRDFQWGNGVLRVREGGGSTSADVGSQTFV